MSMRAPRSVKSPSHIGRARCFQQRSERKIPLTMTFLQFC
jgi:hypothetical protein